MSKSTAAGEAKIPAEPASVAELGALWQKRLRLQDWDIEFQVCRKWEFEDQYVMGDVQRGRDFRGARIRIVDPGDWCDAWMMKYDLEHTIVHELLHLLFKAAVVCRHDERAINTIASALIALARKSENETDRT